jgi:hypothetical protein
MKKTKPCGLCAVNTALKKAVTQKGWAWREPIGPCRACKGAGIVEAYDRPLPKRRKDITGDEWLAEDRKAEWDEYIMNRRDDA